MNNIIEIETSESILKFSDVYIIFNNEFEYFNHPNYNNFIEYLTINNKIAIIFAKCKDGFMQIPINNRIVAYDISEDRNIKKKKLLELEEDFNTKLQEYIKILKQNRLTY